MFFRLINIFVLTLFLMSAPAMAVDWSAIDKLEKDQQFEAAQKLVTEVLAQSIKAKDAENWTKALVKSTDFRIRSGQWETAVKTFKDQPWPADRASQTMLHLYSAYVLKTYLQGYQWEIQQREEIANLKPLDLKKMTKEQLTAVVNQSFDAALNTLPEAYTKVSGMLKESLKIGTYPSHIRGSVRDTISYLWADFLRQENFWSAKQANATDRIAIKRLLVPSAEAISLTDNKIHPLQRYTHLLTNLEKWHTKAGRKEAALEAYRERLLKTFNVLKSEKDKALLIDALSQRNQKEKALPWVTMALWTQATLQQRLVRGDALLLSKATLDNCLALDAKSAGYAYCDNALKRLMEPDFDIQLMKTDGLKKRSVKITHKNVETLYFRVIDGSKVPENQQRGTAADLIPLLLKQPVLWEWSEALPASKDLQSHIRQHQTL